MRLLPNSLIRIIDVNINRLREGLKICEDLLRFHYEDKFLLSNLRRLRHTILPILNQEAGEILPFREVARDLGRRGEFDKKRRKGVVDLFLANLKRIEEALRILEEFYKVKEPKISPVFKEARFSVYHLEKRFFSHYGKVFNPTIYSILDMESLGNFFKKSPPLRDLGYVLAKYSDVIQFRGRKDSPTAELRRQALEVKKGIEKAKSGVKFIINDRVDICLAVDGDGVHLGKRDMPVKEAREIMPDRIIGFTVRSVGDLSLAEKGGCDYVGCGSVFPSPTKPEVQVIGIKGLRAIVKKSSLPVVAIGGISLRNLPAVVKTGVAGVAAVSGFFANGRIRENLLSFRRKWEQIRTKR